MTETIIIAEGNLATILFFADTNMACGDGDSSFHSDILSHRSKKKLATLMRKCFPGFGDDRKGQTFSTIVLTAFHTVLRISKPEIC